MTPKTDAFNNIIYDVILSTDPITGVITYDETSTMQWEFEYELNAAGEVREECDLGAFNSPRTLADSNYEDVYMWACSADCKLIEKKWTDPAGSEYDSDLSNNYDNKSNFKKWECSIDTTEVSWSSKDIKNQTRVIYEQKCNYLCGNRFLEWEEGYGETCDIGGWSHLSQSS